MKKYIPKEMISKSRFKDYYAKWSSDEQKRLLEIMERLIRENSEYADNKNYGHMCNLITSLAMETALEEMGKTRSEAQDAVAQAMYSFIQPKIAPMQKLAGNSWFVGMLKLTMPIKYSHTVGYGWDVEYPKCGSGVYSMVIHKCIYQQIFSKYGMPEMTAIFCKVDDIMYSDLPRAEFIYSEQIGRGGSMCDYTFKKR